MHACSVQRYFSVHCEAENASNTKLQSAVHMAATAIALSHSSSSVLFLFLSLSLLLLSHLSLSLPFSVSYCL